MTAPVSQELVTRDGSAHESPTRPRRWRRVGLIVILLAATHVSLLAWEAYWDSPTWDEPAHLASGLVYWRSGSFRLYCVNPPLVRLFAAAPLLSTKSARLPDSSFLVWNDARSRPEFAYGGQAAVMMGEEYFRLLTYARWAVIPLSVLGAFVCFLWARVLYGDWAGLLAMSLWVFGPMVLAFGHLITPDVGAAALGTAAAYLFWRWLKTPTALRALAAGVLLGLAELTKLTWVILFVLWPTICLMYRLLDRGTPRGWLKAAAQLCLVLVVALWTVNLCYGFEGSFKLLGKYDFGSRMLGGPSASDNRVGVIHNRFAGSWLGRVPMPVPEDYLRGIDVQRVDFEAKSWSYLNGQWRFGGWWYYYLIGLGIKVPLGDWLLVLTAIVVTIYSRRRFSAPLRDELALLIPAIAVIVLLCIENGFNHHVRYALPALPFLYVWAAKLAVWAKGIFSRRLWVIGAMSWSIASSLWVFPHSLSYYNELVGGPLGGHYYLANSNSDWGQDLFYLKRWLDAHPEAIPLHFANDMPFIAPYALRSRVATGDVPVDPRSTDRETVRPENIGPREGWFAVSVNQLRSRGHDFDYFLDLKPVGRAGYSIYIYHITADEAHRERIKLGIGAAAR